MAESVQPAAGTTAGQDPNVVYALGSSPGESARLQRQADELAADSAALLDRVGLRPGHSVIDLGCGPRGILDMLAERVSPAGRVIGLDADPAHTAMAAEFAARRGLSGVEIITANARSTGLATGSFYLVHARTLLINLPDPAGVAAEMMRLTRPGGWVGIHGIRHRVRAVLPASPGLRPALRDLHGGLPPQRRRSVDRPPGAGAVPPGGAGRRPGGGQGAAVPAGQIPADHPP